LLSGHPGCGPGDRPSLAVLPRPLPPPTSKRLRWKAGGYLFTGQGTYAAVLPASLSKMNVVTPAGFARGFQHVT
jgi:hypothetical protein